MGDTLSPKANLNADSRLILVRVKIERAKKHVAELERILRSRSGHKHIKAVISEQNPNTGQILAKGIGTFRFMPFESVAIAGDAIQNLRSALDHLAYQLILVNGKQPTRWNGFPICEDLAAYKREKRGKVKGMRPEAKEAIDRVKPYGGGNDPLWVLHSLNIVDKHRLIFTVGTEFIFHADWINPRPFHTFSVKASKPDFSGVFDRKKEDKINLKIAKPLTQAQIIKSDPLLPTLHQLIDVVERLVFSFKPLLQR